MEKFSEKSEKLKRGRPERWDRDSVSSYSMMISELQIDSKPTSQRGQLNNSLVATALHVLDCKNTYPKYDWLCVINRSGGINGWKKTILIELGRVALNCGYESCREVADIICDLKPKTSVAIVIIRRFRCGKRTASIKQLTKKIIGVLNDYKERYPDTTYEQMHAALVDTMDAVDAVSKLDENAG